MPFFHLGTNHDEANLRPPKLLIVAVVTTGGLREEGFLHVAQSLSRAENAAHKLCALVGRESCISQCKVENVCRKARQMS